MLITKFGYITKVIIYPGCICETILGIIYACVTAEFTVKWCIREHPPPTNTHTHIYLYIYSYLIKYRDYLYSGK